VVTGRGNLRSRAKRYQRYPRVIIAEKIAVLSGINAANLAEWQRRYQRIGLLILEADINHRDHTPSIDERTRCVHAAGA
jgi:hypothetical protein